MKIQAEFNSEVREEPCLVTYIKDSYDDYPDFEVTLGGCVLELTKWEEQKFYEEVEEDYAERRRQYDDYMTELMWENKAELRYG